MNIKETYRSSRGRHAPATAATSTASRRASSVRLSSTDLAFVRLLSSVLKEPEMTVAARLIDRRTAEGQ